jgi:DNA-directed RNA polymerase specialized sigma24 family protein
LTDSQEPFDALLTWLDPDREIAGQKYAVIHAGLVRIFVSQGFSGAEDLADLTINRVVNKLPDIREGYVGEPARYFHGVARNIILEARRRKEIVTDNIPERLSQVTKTSDRYDYLLKCLDLLSSEKRELILDYYLYAGRDKIAHHRRMAEELSITEGALRTRAHHIRGALEKCVLQCIKNLVEKQKRPWKPLLKRRQIIDNIHQEHQP